MRASLMLIAALLVACTPTAGGSPSAAAVQTPAPTARPTARPTVAPTVRITPAPTITPAVEMALVEYGFTYFPGATAVAEYGVVLENPNAYPWAARVSVNITFLTADGAVAASETETIRIALPGERVAVGDAVFPNVEIASMKVSVHSEWEKLTVQPGRFVISNVTTTSDRFRTTTTGLIGSTFAKEQASVRLAAIYHDSAGACIGGHLAFVDFVPSIDTAAVSFEVHPLGKFDNLGDTAVYASP